MNKIEIKVPMLGKEGLEEILKITADCNCEIIIKVDDWITESDVVTEEDFEEFRKYLPPLNISDEIIIDIIKKSLEVKK